MFTFIPIYPLHMINNSFLCFTQTELHSYSRESTYISQNAPLHILTEHCATVHISGVLCFSLSISQLSACSPKIIDQRPMVGI